jgi:hypothetical protein
VSRNTGFISFSFLFSFLVSFGFPRFVEKAHSRQRQPLVPVVETGESGDVETRARPHSDGTCLCRARVWHSGTHSRKRFQM